MSFSNSTYEATPSVTRRDRHVVRRLVSAIFSQWPERVRGSPPLPNDLRRDIGLPPIYEPPSHWNYYR